MKTEAGRTIRRSWAIRSQAMLWLLLVPVLGRAVVHVDPHALGDATGEDWINAYPSIREAVNDPRSATEPIWIAGGVYQERLNIPAGRVLLGGFTPGMSDPEQRDPSDQLVLLDGTILVTTGSMILVDDPGTVRIDGLWIRGGTAVGEGDARAGGGIRVSGAGVRLELSRVRILENTAIDGGGIAVLGGAHLVLELDDQFNIEENIARDDGGGIYLTNGASAEIRGARPTFDYDPNSGVPLHVRSNRCDDRGGGIYASSGSSISLSNLLLNGNHADPHTTTTQGGGLFLRDNSSATLNDVSFRRNEAGGAGGAIGVEDSTLTLTDSRIHDNNLRGQQGTGTGIFATGSTLNLTRTRIHENTSPVDQGTGGGLTVFGCPTVSLTDTDIMGNTATLGGGIFNIDSTVTMHRGLVQDNRTHNGEAGTIAYVAGSGTLASTNTLFIRNMTFSGIYGTDDARITLVQPTFANNVSPLVLDQQARATVRNGIFYSSSDYAIRELTTESDVTMIHCLFADTEFQDLLDEGLQNFSGAAAINTFVDGAINVVDGEPHIRAFNDFQQTYRYDFRIVDDSNMTITLEQVSPELEPGALRGGFIRGVSGGLFLRVADNTENSMTLLATENQISLSESLFIADFSVDIDSPALDAGIDSGIPATDYRGQPRPVDIAGFGPAGGTVDIGAGEAQPTIVPQAVYVRAGDGRTVTNGLSWDRAYDSIQAAIDDPRSAQLPIHVEAGATFEENIMMQSGRRLYGGVEPGSDGPDYLDGGLVRSGRTVLNSATTGDDFRLMLFDNVSDTQVWAFTFDSGLADNNQVEGGLFGGAVYARSGGDGNLFRACTFMNNGANAGGGAVAMFEGASLRFETCSFRDNSANGNGGAIYAGPDTRLELSGAFLESNTAVEERGGGLYMLNAASLDCVNSSFRSGSALLEGGGMALDSVNEVQLTGTSIFDNDAGNGGGIFTINTTARITDMLCWSNRAFSQGGGLYLGPGSDIEVEAGDFVNNRVIVSASGDGGAIHVEDAARCILRNNFLRDNTILNGRGAGIFVGGAAIVFIEDNQLIDNRTGANGLGGGIFVDNSEAHVRGNTLLRNRAWIGGGLYLVGSVPPAEQNRIVQNRATGDGGGVYLNDVGTTGGLVNNLVHINGADDDGAGVYVLDGAPLIAHNTISRNVAVDIGGGILVHRAGPSLLNNIFSLNQPGQIRMFEADTQPAAVTNNFFDNNNASNYRNAVGLILSLEELNGVDFAEGNFPGEYAMVEQAFPDVRERDGGQGTSQTEFGGESKSWIVGEELEPGALVGRFVTLNNVPQWFLVDRNTDSSLLIGEIDAGNVSIETFQLRDPRPMPYSGSVDTATTGGLQLAVDLRGQPRPFKVNEAVPGSIDIGAYEAGEEDLREFLLPFLLGQITSFPTALLDALDLNGDGVVDIADMVTLVNKDG